MSKHLTFNNQIYFSSQEAGKTAGYTSDYVAKLCREGNLTCERVGRSWFVEENSLKEFVIAREHEKAARLQQLSEQRKSEYYEQEIEEAELPKVAAAAAQSVVRVAQPVARVASHAVQAQEYAYFDPYTYTFAQAPITGTYFRKVLAEQEDQRRAQRALIPYTPIVPADTFREFGQKTVALLTAFAIVFGSTAISGEQYLAAPARIAQAFDRSVQVAMALPQTLATADEVFEEALLAFDAFTVNPRLPEFNRNVLAQVNAIEWLQNSYDSAISFFRGAGTRLVTNTGLIGSGNVRGQVDIQIRAVQETNTAVADAGAAHNTTPARIVYIPGTTTQAPERTTIVQNQPVIERVVETERIVVQSGVTLEQLQQTENELRKEIARVGADNATDIGDNFHSIALTQRIDTLGGVLITNSRIRNSSVEATSLTVADDASFAEDVTIAGTLTVTGTTTFSSLVANDLTYTGTLTTPLSAGIAHINGFGALTSATGTANTIAKFNATGVALADSILIDDGVVVTVGGGLAVSGTTTLATTTITDATITNLSGTNATLTNATSTNFFSSVLTAITGAFTNFSATNATTTNLVATNATTTNLSSSDITTDTLTATGTTTLATTSITNATVTDITATNATSTNLVVTGSTALATTTITDADVTRLVATYATTTTLFGANATFTNATTTNFFTNALTVITGAFTNFTATNATTTNLVATDATVTDLSATDAVFTNATSTNFFANLLTAVTSSVTNFSATNATTTNLVATNATTTDLVATGTTALATTTITDATITDADITRLIASYATTTTLFGANATFTDAVFMNATSTNFYSNLVTAITGIFTNLTATNATLTNATTTNLVVTGDTALGTTTIGAVSVDSIDATDAVFTNATSTNFFSNILTAITGAFTNFTATNATTTNLVVTGSADLATTTINGILTVDGGAIVIGNTNTDTLTINSAINSDIIPDQNAVRDLGSPSYFWDEIYADNINVNSISAASTTIGGTANNSFTINTDNVTSDDEDVNLVFFRGTVVPNAVIAWDSDTERFDINQPFYIQNDSSTTTVPTLQLVGKTGQTAPVLVADSSAGARLFTITHSGNIGVGTSSPSAKFAVSGNAYVSGTTTLYGGLTVSTGTVSLPAGQIDNAELANSTVSYGGITLSLGGSDATPAFNLIDATGLPIDAGTTGTLPVARGGTGATTLNNLITLGTHTTGNYLATLADAGNSFFTVANSGTESAAVTLDIVNDSLDFAQFKNALTLDATTTVAMSYPLNFDSNTLYIDPTNNRVGVGNANPLYDVDVANAAGGVLSIRRTGDSSISEEIIGQILFTADTDVNGGDSDGIGAKIIARGTGGGWGSQSLDYPTSLEFYTQTNSVSNGFASPRMIITDSGNIGIDNPSPTSLLQLGTTFDNDATTPTLSFGDGDTGFYESADDQLRIALAGTNYFTFLASRFTAQNGAAVSNSASSATTPVFIPSTGALTAGVGGSGGDVSIITDGAARLYVTSSGNVGIGTTSPSSLLHVYGPSGVLTLQDSNSAQNTAVSRIDFNYNTGTNGLIGYSGSEDLLITNNHASGDILLSTNGNVGIGDTSPAALFTVGSGDLFQVNSSGAIAAATGITSSGAINFTGTLAVSGTTTLATTTATALTVSNGLTVSGGGAAITGNSTIAGTLSSLTGITSSGTITFSALTSGILRTNGSGVLSTTTINGSDVTADTLDFTEFKDALTLDATTTIAMSYPLNFDSNTLYIDPTNNRVGVGTASPNFSFQINDNTITTKKGLYVASRFGPSGAYLRPANSSGQGSSLELVANQNTTLARAWSISNPSGASSNFGLVFSSAPSSVDIDSFSYTTRMQLDALGDFSLFEEAGVNAKFFWDASAEKLGIGTTSPSAKLHILGASEQLRLSYNASAYWTDTIASDGGRTIAGFGTDADLNLNFSGATDGDFSVNTDDLFVDTSTGRVGIGDTSPAALLTVGNGDLFQVNSSGAIAAATGITSSGTITFTDTLSVTGTSTLATTTAIQLTTTGNTYLATSGGNVGVGTTSPSAKLHVNGNSIFEGSTTYINAAQDYALSGTSSGWFGLVGQSSGLGSVLAIASNDADGTDESGLVVYGFGGIGSGNRERLIVNWDVANSRYEIQSEANGTGTLRDIALFTEGNTNQLVLSSSGNVGIGDSSPAALFTVGNGDLFQVNSSGAIAAATGITSSGAINFTGTLSVTGTTTLATTTATALIASNGLTVSGGGAAITGNSTIAGTLGSLTGITSSGTITFSGLTSGILRTNGSGVLSTTTINGSDVTADTLDFTEFKDALTLDASTTINVTGSNVFSITNTGSGNSFVVNDQGSDSTPFIIDAAGNVGIGTTPGAYKLYVDGSAYVNGLITAGAVDNNGYNMLRDPNNKIFFGRAAYNSLSESNGNYAPLVRGYTNNFGGFAYYFGYKGLYASTTATGAPQGELNNGANAALFLGVNTDGSTYFSAGNVGIGDTSPSALLTVGNGDLFQVNSSGAIAAATGITSSGAISFTGTLAVSGTSTFATTTVTGDLAVNTDDLFVDTANGRVGIGTTTPSSKLTVAGAVTADSFISTSTATSTFAGGISIAGSIVPTTDNTYSLGTPSLQWQDVYIGPGSLYINGQKVIEEDASNIVVTADTNQSLHLKTAGSGDIELNPTGTGIIALKGNIQITGGKVISTSDNSLLEFEDGIQGGNLSVSGNAITATNLNGGIALTPNGSGNTYVTANNFGIGDTSPAALLTVGNGDLFQVNSSGAIAAATGITSSGAISFTGTLSVTGTTTLATTTAAEITASGNVNATRFLAASGSGASPAYSFTDDTDTGMFYSSANGGTMNFVIGGGTRFYTQGTGSYTVFNGNIFAANTSGWMLENAASSLTNPTLVPHRSSSTTGIGGDGADKLALITAGTTALTVDSSQNIGIGTTSPLAKLDVYGDMVLSGSDRYLNFGTAVGTSSYGIRDNAGTLQYKNSGGSWADLGSGGSSLTGTTGQIAYFSGTNTAVGTSTIYLAADGKVGIGTESPKSKLDVLYSDTQANPAAASLAYEPGTSHGLEVWNTSNSANYSGIYLRTRTTGASTWSINNEWKSSNSGDLTFVTRSGGSTLDERMRITNAGNVGIGTSSPFGGWTSAPDKGIHIEGDNPQLGLYDTGGGDRWGVRAASIGLSFFNDTDNEHRLLVDNDGNVGIGTTNPSAKLSLGTDITTIKVAAYDNGSIAYGMGVNGGKLTFGANIAVDGTPQAVLTSSGDFGIGVVTPTKRLSVTETVSDAQFIISYDATRYTTFQVDSTGDLIVDAYGDDVRLNDDNLWVCSGGSCPAGTPSGNGNIIAETAIGIGTSTPWTSLAIAAGGAITVEEELLTTSGTIAVDWRDGNQQLIRLTTSAATINFSGYIAGQKLSLITCSPNGSTAGAITWGTTIRWTGGTAPTQTTTADKCDVWSFLATSANGTLRIFGAQTPNFTD